MELGSLISSARCANHFTNYPSTENYKRLNKGTLSDCSFKMAKSKNDENDKTKDMKIRLVYPKERNEDLSNEHRCSTYKTNKQKSLHSAFDIELFSTLQSNRRNAVSQSLYHCNFYAKCLGNLHSLFLQARTHHDT